MPRSPVRWALPPLDWELALARLQPTQGVGDRAVTRPATTVVAIEIAEMGTTSARSNGISGASSNGISGARSNGARSNGISATGISAVLTTPALTINRSTGRV